MKSAWVSTSQLKIGYHLESKNWKERFEMGNKACLFTGSDPTLMPNITSKESSYAYKLRADS